MRRFGTYGERAWYAWYCLDERNKFGEPTPARELERRSDELNQGELSRMLHGEYREPSWRVAKAAAAVLRVDPEWLMDEKGKGPALPYGYSVPSWPGPRPSAERRKPPSRVRRKRSSG